jgi:glycosyltransferase involved in cell wall biosynthesis
MSRHLETGEPAAFRAERELDVLIPTRDRAPELAVTLSGLAAQHRGPAGLDFGVVVSDQSDGPPPWGASPVAAMVRVLRHGGRPVLLTAHLPRRGLAENRAYLLALSTARYVLCLDDDVWLEPGAVDRMLTAIRELGCGFVGSFVHGLSYVDDVRPDTHDAYEEWPGRPEPEQVRPGTPEWDRARVHAAANLLHLTRRLGLGGGEWRAYKVAWVGGCVLYDRRKLIDAGGFEFWRRVPAEHAGEDVAAQLAVMAEYAGAGIVPSGAYHQEAPTTVPNRDVQVHEVLLAEAGTGSLG